jgi:hypothetical protein
MEIQNLVIDAVVIGAVAFAVFKVVQNRKIDVDVRTVAQLPASLQSVVSKMKPEAQNAFFIEYRSRRRKVWLSYLAWMAFGFHYLYNRKVGVQFLFWLTGFGLLVWGLVDLFRMPSIVAEANSVIAREIVNTLSLGSTFDSN